MGIVPLETRNLTEEDWDKLAKLGWDENEAKFLALLRKRKNGPLSVSEIEAAGIVWKERLFVMHFNMKLKKKADDFQRETRSGNYYCLRRPDQQLACYVIKKIGY